MRIDDFSIAPRLPRRLIKLIAIETYGMDSNISCHPSHFPEGERVRDGRGKREEKLVPA